MPQSNYECKPIPGFPRYFADTNGEIWRMKNKRKYKHRNGLGTGKVIGRYLKKLKPSVRVRGYLFTSFSLKHKPYPKSIHRVIASVFIPNPDNKPYVCHKNDITSDNRVENLFWGTAKENTQDCIRKERRNTRKGETHGCHKITEAMVKYIRLRFKQGSRQCEIQKELNIPKSMVHRVVLKKTWKHI